MTRGRKAHIAPGSVLGAMSARRALAALGYEVSEDPPPEEAVKLLWPGEIWEGEGPVLHAAPLPFGLAGDPTALGLRLDTAAAPDQALVPSALEEALATRAFDDTAALDRARALAEYAARHDLSHASRATAPRDPPAPGYVLVIDEARDDPAVTLGAPDAGLWGEMLVAAQLDHPGCAVLILPPAPGQPGQPGHYGLGDLSRRVGFVTAPHNIQALFSGAVGVYAMTSMLGMHAIHAGHKPQIFGQPVYAGWGLTRDFQPVARRERVLTRAQLMLGMAEIGTQWCDPRDGAPCDAATALAGLAQMLTSQTPDGVTWMSDGAP